MNLTARLKKWLVENCDVKANADDATFRKAAGDAIADGTLPVEKLEELTSEKSVEDEDEDVSEFVGVMKGLASSVEELTKTVKEDRKAKETKTQAEEEEDDESVKECPACSKEMKSLDSGQLHCGDCEITIGKAKEAPKEKAAAPTALQKMIFRPLDDEEKDISVRVKEAAESYSTTKSAMSYPSHNSVGKSHPFAGRPVLNEFQGGTPIDNPSELDKAVVGAWAKFLCATAHVGSRTIGFQQLPQHDRELICHALEKMNWSGASDGGNEADIKNRRLTPAEQKALIDDAASGGVEAAPIVFDDDIITTPLLHGELFPLVSKVPLDRGRRVEGVATGTVTGSWGGVDDSAISLFNTASYVTAFDTTIFRWEGAIRIGLDFLSDTPIDFGAHITAQYGERLLEDLDDVVATGNGTNQPEGVMNKSGTTSVSFGSSTTIGNYESLRFGVAKPEHRANLISSAVFCGTETSYQRARAIPVGNTDARRLGGMDYSSYQWMERPFKINESLANTQLFYAILARYRMYVRRGLTIRRSTEGDTLIRNNEMLLVAMARYGGQLERGAVAAVATDAPS